MRSWWVLRAGLVVGAVWVGRLPGQELEAYRQLLPGTLVEFEMRPVPAGAVELPAGTTSVEAFWIGRTEVPWELYDIFALRLDLPREDRMRGVDAEARPSRPYGAPDHGFGHRGYAAVSVTYHAAQAFCAWLSAMTGHTYRLPTDAQWTHAVRSGLGDSGAASHGGWDETAWHGDNAMNKPHPVATKTANALGVFDMVGNVWEWVNGADGPVVRGGSYRDTGERIGPDARAVQDPSWNVTDPQIPKSRWWLSDGPFIGFRIVRIPQSP